MIKRKKKNVNELTNENEIADLENQFSTSKNHFSNISQNE